MEIWLVEGLGNEWSSLCWCCYCVDSWLVLIASILKVHVYQGGV